MLTAVAGVTGTLTAPVEHAKYAMVQLINMIDERGVLACVFAFAARGMFCTVGPGWWNRTKCVVGINFCSETDSPNNRADVI